MIVFWSVDYLLTTPVRTDNMGWIPSKPQRPSLCRKMLNVNVLRSTPSCTYRAEAAIGLVTRADTKEIGCVTYWRARANYISGSILGSMRDRT